MRTRLLIWCFGIALGWFAVQVMRTPLATSASAVVADDVPQAEFRASAAAQGPTELGPRPAAIIEGELRQLLAKVGPALDFDAVRRLVRELAKSDFPRLMAFAQHHSAAFLATGLDRDMAWELSLEKHRDLMAGLVRSPPTARVLDQLFGRALVLYADVDPALCWKQWMQERHRLPDGSRMLGELAQSWAKRAPYQAVMQGHALADARDRDRFLHVAMPLWFTSHPQSFAAWWRQQPDRQTLGTQLEHGLRQTTVEASSPESLAQLLNLLPEIIRDPATLNELLTRASLSRHFSAEMVSAIRDPRARDAAATALAVSQLETAPQTPQLVDPANRFTLECAKLVLRVRTDPEDAFLQAARLSDPKQRTAALLTVMEAMSEENPMSYLRLLSEHPEVVDDSIVLRPGMDVSEITVLASAMQPALELVMRGSTSEVRAEAMSRLLNRQTETEPSPRVNEWLLAQCKDLATRETMLTALCWKSDFVSPDLWNAATQITDPTLRARALGDLVKLQAIADPASTRQWLQSPAASALEGLMRQQLLDQLEGRKPFANFELIESVGRVGTPQSTF